MKLRQTSDEEGQHRGARTTIEPGIGPAVTCLASQFVEVLSIKLLFFNEDLEIWNTSMEGLRVISETLWVALPDYVQIFYEHYQEEFPFWFPSNTVLVHGVWHAFAHDVLTTRDPRFCSATSVPNFSLVHLRNCQLSSSCGREFEVRSAMFYNLTVTLAS